MDIKINEFLEKEGFDWIKYGESYYYVKDITPVITVMVFDSYLEEHISISKQVNHKRFGGCDRSNCFHFKVNKVEDFKKLFNQIDFGY